MQATWTSTDDAVFVVLSSIDTGVRFDDEQKKREKVDFHFECFVLWLRDENY